MSDNKTDTNRHAKIGTMGPHECECFYWSLTKWLIKWLHEHRRQQRECSMPLWITLLVCSPSSGRLRVKSRPHSVAQTSYIQINLHTNISFSSDRLYAWLYLCRLFLLRLEFRVINGALITAAKNIFALCSSFRGLFLSSSSNSDKWADVDSSLASHHSKAPDKTIPEKYDSNAIPSLLLSPSSSISPTPWNVSSLSHFTSKIRRYCDIDASNFSLILYCEKFVMNKH